MVQALIKGRVEKEQPPAAPLEDEAEILQHLMDVLEGRMLDSPRIEALEPILLGSLRDGRLRVHSPIKIKFTKEDKHVIAEVVEINEFGFGENPSEAIADLQRTIAELYFTLEKEQDRLGTDLRRVWAVLQEKIHKR
jgi:hypothetical protein